MAIVKTKGTLLQVTISSTLTTIGQIISFNKAEDKGESFESDYLEKTGPGIPMTATGRVTVGEISGELFLDPADASHEFIMSQLETPPTTAVASKIVLADGATEEITFDVVAFGLGAAVALGDGLKAPFSLTLEDLPEYPDS